MSGHDNSDSSEECEARGPQRTQQFAGYDSDDVIRQKSFGELQDSPISQSPRKCDKSKSVKLKKSRDREEDVNGGEGSISSKHLLLKRISSAPNAVMSSIFSSKNGDSEPNLVKRASLKLKKRYSEKKVVHQEDEVVDERMKELTEEDFDYLTANTAVEREELKRQFSNFLEKHPNGCITKKDFSSIMRTCFPERDFDILEKRIFHMYDKNGDGKISFTELMTVMYIMSTGTPEDNLKQIFRIFDADGNGEVTRQEMKKLVKDICALLCDEEGVKRSKSDMKQMTADAMKEMDTNCDGKIDEEEFVRAIMSHEKVASMLTLKIVEVFDPDNFAKA